MNAKNKVIFCTYSSIYSSKVLEKLIADTDIEVVAIVNSTRVLRPSLNSIQGAITQLKISGLRYSTYLFFITDLFKWMQPLYSLQERSLKNIHTLAKHNNIPIVDTKDINTIQSIGFIKEYKPDFLLCAHFNQLLKEPILEIKNMQCINIHPSLLPKYKGVDPVFFAMCDEAIEIGVTLHKMNEVFDSGKILSQTVMKLEDDASLLINNCFLFEKGAKLAISWMKNQGSLITTAIQDDNKDENYDSWPTSDDVKSFKKSSKKLVSLSDLWSHK